MLIGKALSFIMNFVRAEDGHQMYFGDSVVGRLELGDNIVSHSCVPHCLKLHGENVLNRE